MKKVLFLSLAMLLVTSGARAQLFSSVVAPNGAAGLEGASGNSTAITSSERALQIAIKASQLTPILDSFNIDPLKGDITGLTFRLNSTAGEPNAQPNATNFPAGIDFANYDIYIGQSAISPFSQSTTFADNYVGGTKTQVRSGALHLDAGYFPKTAPSAGIPNDFGAFISFNLGGYKYTGGDLIIEIRHSGNASTDFALDAVSSGTNYSAIRSSDPGAYGATVATAANTLIPVMNIQFSSAAPEPGTFALLGLGSLGLFVARRRSRQA